MKLPDGDHRQHSVETQQLLLKPRRLKHDSAPERKERHDCCDHSSRQEPCEDADQTHRTRESQRDGGHVFRRFEWSSGAPRKHREHHPRTRDERGREDGDRMTTRKVTHRRHDKHGHRSRRQHERSRLEERRGRQRNERTVEPVAPLDERVERSAQQPTDHEAKREPQRTERQREEEQPTGDRGALQNNLPDSAEHGVHAGSLYSEVRDASIESQRVTLRADSNAAVKHREHQWSVWALAVSVLVHVFVGVWLYQRPAVKTEKRTVTAEFIFTEPTPPAKAPEPEPEPQKAPEPARPPPKPVVKAPPRVEQPPPPKPVAAPAPSEPKNDTPVNDAPVNDAPVQEKPILDVPRAAPSAALLPDSMVVSARLDAGVEPEIVMKTGLRALEAPKNIVGDLARETLGRGRVERGLVHPYYTQLGKALVKNWDAERVAKSGLKGLIEQTGENIKQYNDIWSKQASTYGAGGSPIANLPRPGGRAAPVNDRIGGGLGVDMDQKKELQRAMAQAFKATRQALIRVVQDPSGRVLKVELVQPSNDDRVDKEALVDVKNAAASLPAPPAEALDGKTQLISVWSFELTVSISPPVPTFTFEFDEALGFIDARLPLDRRIYKKVRLVSVE